MVTLLAFTFISASQKSQAEKALEIQNSTETLHSVDVYSAFILEPWLTS